MSIFSNIRTGTFRMEYLNWRRRIDNSKLEDKFETGSDAVERALRSTRLGHLDFRPKASPGSRAPESRDRVEARKPKSPVAQVFSFHLTLCEYALVLSPTAMQPLCLFQAAAR